MIVVADTGPLYYLVLIGEITRVHAVFGTILIPPAVQTELLALKQSNPVRQWVANLPPWVEVCQPQDSNRLEGLGPGECDAILLAIERKADFLLIDESKGRAVAVRHGVCVKGCLGVLEEFDIQNLPDFDFCGALARLTSTNIFIAEDIVKAALRRHSTRRDQL